MFECGSADAKRIAAALLTDLQELFTETGVCQDWLPDAKSLNVLLDGITDNKSSRLFVRCGLLDNVIWTFAVQKIWKDKSGVELADVRLRASKLLYESVFVTWRLRHDVTWFC